MSRAFAGYDRRAYPTMPVGAGYAAWAPSYDETADPELDLALLEALENVPWRGARLVADLACGTGRVGAWLRSRGAVRIHGADLSEAMLARAAGKGVYELLARCDLALTPFAEGGYDLVVSVLAACHLERLEDLYREAARLASPSGRFVLLDYHPYFLLAGIPTHFMDRGGNPVAIANVIHLFSDHVNAGRRAGMELVEMRERLVDQDWIARRSSMEKFRGQPVSFALVWRARHGEETFGEETFK